MAIQRGRGAFFLRTNANKFFFLANPVFAKDLTAGGCKLRKDLKNNQKIVRLSKIYFRDENRLAHFPSSSKPGYNVASVNNFILVGKWVFGGALMGWAELGLSS